jgi:predicted transcriptional regulator of viral defense system
MSAKDTLRNTHAGIELVRLLGSEGHRILSTALARELAPKVELGNAYLPEALYHLRQTGWIVALRRGIYALASPVPGATSAHEHEIAVALADPAAISHWSALHHPGLTEQPPTRVFVLTTTDASIPRTRRAGATGEYGYRVLGTSYQFVQVRPERYFGTQTVWVGEARVSMTDPERTLLDGLAMPQYFGDLAEVLHAFAVRGADLDLDRIIGYAVRSDVAVAKRLGRVLENEGLPLARLEHLAALPVKGYRTLDATGPRIGSRNRRWMVQENLPGRVKV